MGDQVVFSPGAVIDGINLFRLPLARRERVTFAPRTRLTPGGGTQLGVAAAKDGRMLFTDMVLRINFLRVGLDPATGRSVGEPQPVNDDSTVNWKSSAGA